MSIMMMKFKKRIDKYVDETIFGVSWRELKE